MIKIDSKGKEWARATDEEKISYLDGLFESSKQARLRRDMEWYLNHLFLEGEHYAYYNSETNALERPPRDKGEVRLVINKIKSSVRAVENYSTRFFPKWEIVPGDLDPETIVNARRSGKLLDYLYRHLHLESVVSGIVNTGLNTSVGIVELDWDERADDGLGQVLFKMHDPFDVWFDPMAFLYAGKVVGRYIFKAIKKPLEEVFYDNRYDKKNRMLIETDDDLAASPIKARIIRKEQGSNENDRVKRTTVKEVLLWDDEKNEKGGYITLFTYAGKIKLREKPLDLKEFPIYVFQIPQDPRKIYHRAWVSDAVPLNKVLDRVISQEVMYVNQALVFRIIAEKGSGIDTIDNEHGQVYELNPGRKWQQMQMFPLPSTIHLLSSELRTSIEDVMSAHEATVGQMPAGARAGVIIEALQAAESNNLSGIRHSLESFLSIVGKKALEIVSDKYVASRVIKISEPEMTEGGERVDYLKVIGKGAGNKPGGSTIITGDDEVIVKIGSWLGYTVEAQRETLLDLSARGIIPREEVLRYFEFPNINEISEKAKKEALEEHILKAEIAGRNQQAGGGGGQAQSPAVAIADQEMTTILNGTDLPPTQGATPEHIQAEYDLMSSYLFNQAPPDRQNAAQAHVQGEIQAQGGQVAVR